LYYRLRVPIKSGDPKNLIWTIPAKGRYTD